jgi:hypothetical protein
MLLYCALDLHQILEACELSNDIRTNTFDNEQPTDILDG